MNLAPKTALVQRGEQPEEIPVEELAVGELFIVKPGTTIATDGIVVEGSSDVNQAPITGESQPVSKQPGDAVFAASINGPAALKVRATKTFADNTVARIIQMVEEAQEKKGTSQRLIENSARDTVRSSSWRRSWSPWSLHYSGKPRGRHGSCERRS